MGKSTPKPTSNQFGPFDFVTILRGDLLHLIVSFADYYWLCGFLQRNE